MIPVKISKRSVIDAVGVLLKAHRNNAVIIAYGKPQLWIVPAAETKYSRVIGITRSEHLRGREPNFVVIPLGQLEPELYRMALTHLGRRHGPAQLILCLAN